MTVGMVVTKLDVVSILTKLVEGKKSAAAHRVQFSHKSLKDSEKRQRFWGRSLKVCHTIGYNSSLGNSFLFQNFEKLCPFL